MLKRNCYLVDHIACPLVVYNSEWRDDYDDVVCLEAGAEIRVLNLHTGQVIP